MENLKKRKNTRYKCRLCDFLSYNYKTSDVHFSRTHVCQKCGNTFPNLTNHTCDGQAEICHSSLEPWILSKEAHLKVLRTYTLEELDSSLSIGDLFISRELDFQKLFVCVLKELLVFKAQIVLFLTLQKIGTEITQDVYLHGFSTPFTHISQLGSYLYSQASHIISTVNNYSELGSKWVILKYNSISVNLAQYRTIEGTGFMPLPLCLKNRYSLLNVMAFEPYCFQYCICIKYFQCKFKVFDKKKLCNSNLYDHFLRTQKVIKFDWYESGISVKDIDRFEKQNPSWSVNIFSVVDHEQIRKRADLWAVRLTTEEKKFHVDLILVNKNDKFHYIYINDFNTFMGKKGRNRQFWCKCCMQKFSCEEKQKQHSITCRKFGKQTIKFPTKLNLSVNPLSYSLMYPIHIVADFETIGLEIDNVKKGMNTVLQKVHKPCSYSLCVMNFDKVLEKEFYVGEDAHVQLINRLLQLSENYMDLMFKNKFYEESVDDQDVLNAKECGLCKQAFGEKEIRVVHHLHWDSSLLPEGTSSFVCFAHQACNLQVKNPQNIPVFFHGLSNFDSHLLIQGVSKSRASNVRCLAKSSEKFLCLFIHKLKIMDSFAHLPASLSSLVSDLRKAGLEHFKITAQVFGNDILDLLVRKQAFPYEFITFKNLAVKRNNLPPIEDFSTSLTAEKCTDELYQMASLLYKHFKCNSLLDFLQIYNLLDVTLLADVLACQRKMAKSHFDMEMFRFVSSPSFVFHAAIASSKISLEFVRDVQIHQMVRMSIRGGIVNVPCRWAKANVPGTADYNKQEKESHIIFLDFTGLYSSQMLEPLPVGGYKYFGEKELETFDVTLLNENLGLGWLVCCDVEIPTHLHDYFDDLPPLADKITLDATNLSMYQNKFIKGEYSISVYPGKTEMLSLNLFDKKNYVSYYKLLKYVCKLGVKISKYHAVVQYKEKAFLKDYINYYTEKRNMAESEVGKSFYKYMCNCLFGSFLLQKEKYHDCKIVQDVETCYRCTSKPSFKNFTIIDNELSIIELQKTNVLLNRFPIIGSQILELSKLHFYKVYYSVLVPYFGKRLKKLYMDTDSILMKLESSNPYGELAQLEFEGEPLCDFSNLPKNSPHYSEVVKGKLGKLKCELKGETCLEYVALAKKQYSLLLQTTDGIESRCKSKGIPKQCIKNETFYTYKKTLFKKKFKTQSFNNLRAYQHQIYQTLMEKISFSPVNFSRFLLGEYGIESVPYGYKNLCSEEMELVKK